MAIIQDWKIRTTNAQCELTGEPFVDEQVFYTCIFDDPESDGFLRKDYSVESWEKIRNEIDPAPFSFWKSTYKAPVPEVDEKRIEDTSAEGMLRRFIEEDDSRTEHARYILALMLERKKTLVPTDSKETETRKLLFYEHEETGDVFIVADPGLKLDEIEVVQQEVAALLAAEEAKSSVAGSDVHEPAHEGSGDEAEAPEKQGQEAEKAEDETVA
ncbi:MAG: hypothetical protein P1U85_05935 [Verrucomicrobiales bacterium]|nr:hypothetical protein [Verrucomicrobiales bacterium]